MRRLPGRIVGETKDADGKRAYVMTLRTREQDIRRERATSNICTNEALYALAATVYLATMGQQGLRGVAELSLQKAHYAAQQICTVPGFELMYPEAAFFKEFAVKTSESPEDINSALLSAGVIGGLPISGPDGRGILFCVTEQRTRQEIDHLVELLRAVATGNGDIPAFTTWRG
jgi:glycine dehydrogenase subunit 1